MIYLLVINQNYQLRQTMKSILEKETHIQVLDQAENVLMANQIMDSSKKELDMVILDINLNGFEPEGLMYASHIRQTFPELKILVFSFYKWGSYIYQMYKSDIHGYLFADNFQAEMIPAVNAIYQGDRYYRGEVQGSLEKYQGYLQVEDSPPFFMTQRELDYIQSLANLQSVYDRPFYPPNPNSIEQSIWKNITYKLGTSDENEIIDTAYRLGFLPN